MKLGFKICIMFFMAMALANIVSAYHYECYSEGQTMHYGIICEAGCCKVCVTDSGYPTSPNYCFDAPDCVCSEEALPEIEPAIITIISPVEGETYSEEKIMLSVSTSRTVPSISYALNDDTSYQTLCTSCNSYSGELSLSDGDHKITFRIMDNDEEIFESVNFKINTTCIEDWICSEWGECIDGFQNRTCNDDSNCGTTDDRPKLTQECEEDEKNGEECIPNWECTPWEPAECNCTGVECEDFKQTRECHDTKECDTDFNNPDLERKCPYCGDGVCNEDEGENCENCPEDCGECPAPAPAPTGGGGGGGGGGGFTPPPTQTCTPSWECTEWSECIGFTQTRICTDLNNCNDASGKPAEEQMCVPPEETGQQDSEDEIIEEEDEEGEHKELASEKAAPEDEDKEAKADKEPLESPTAMVILSGLRGNLTAAIIGVLVLGSLAVGYFFFKRKK